MSRYWTSLEDLEAENLVDKSPALTEVAAQFQIKVSPVMQQQLASASQEERSAIIKQFVPTALEANILPSELSDPIGDKRFTPVTGVVHRYPDRALLKVTQLCEVYCRFCFRKEMIGKKGEMLSQEEIANAMDYFSQHQELWEVILTGGDPLILSVRRMRHILIALTQIDHIQSIRIHSRIPIISPELLTEDYLDLLEEIVDSGKAVILVIHANHPAEFSAAASGLLVQLRKRGVLLLSQSVMLKGVNDDLATLTQLMRTFIENGVKPYYLHQMDLARGTNHFVVEDAVAIALVNALRESISGICIPRLILEIPEGEGKKVLA